MTPKNKSSKEQPTSEPQTGTRNDPGISREPDGPATNSPVADVEGTAAESAGEEAEEE